MRVHDGRHRPGWQHPRSLRPDLGHELHGDAWFAGFIDGEGHFSVAKVAEGGYQVALEISLRDDDWEILEDILLAFGGTVREKRTRRPGQHQQMRYVGSSRATLSALIAYLDAHPLRAKKADDYAIWRRAAEAYIEGGWRASGLESLKADLTVARAYRDRLARN